VFSKPCPQKGSSKLKSIFSKKFSSGWILLVPNLSLLKYFDITLPRHKSSKTEGSGPTLMSHSMQLHCVCFRFSTVSKRETVYTRCHMQGIYVPTLIQSFAGVWFNLWEKFAKNRKKSIEIVWCDSEFLDVWNSIFPDQSFPQKKISQKKNPYVASAQGWRNCTLISHEPLVCSKICLKNGTSPIMRTNGTIS